MWSECTGWCRWRGGEIAGEGRAPNNLSKHHTPLIAAGEDEMQTTFVLQIQKTNKNQCKIGAM